MAIYEPTADRLSKAFSALADPTRRAILARLATGEATVSELLAPFELSQPTISKHLKVLEDAGFIELTHYYRPEGVPFEEQPWLASLWRRAQNY